MEIIILELKEQLRYANLILSNSKHVQKEIKEILWI